VEILSILKGLKELESLSLTVPAKIDVLKEVFSMSTVQELEVEVMSDDSWVNPDMNDEDIYDAVESMKSIWEELVEWKADVFKQYKRLGLVPGECLSHKTTAAVMSAFTRATMLQSLSFSLYGVTDDALTMFSNDIHQQENLTCLDMTLLRNEYDDEEVFAEYSRTVSLKPISQLKQLTNLHIGHYLAPIQDLDHLKDMPNLTFVDWGSHLTGHTTDEASTARHELDMEYVSKLNGYRSGHGMSEIEFVR
jgi:hypothetical protein